MAKVTYAPLVNSMSGRFGGVVFSGWKGIQLVRRHVNPANPKTDSQQAVRNIFTWANFLMDDLSPVTQVGDIFNAGWKRWAEQTGAVMYRNGLIQAVASAVTAKSLAGLESMAESAAGRRLNLRTPTLAITATYDSSGKRVTITVPSYTRPPNPTGYDATQVTFFAVLDYDPTGSRPTRPINVTTHTGDPAGFTFHLNNVDSDPSNIIVTHWASASPNGATDLHSNICAAGTFAQVST